MLTSALAVAGPNLIRRNAGTAAGMRVQSMRAGRKAPILNLSDLRPLRYRARAGTARLVALGVTAAVHFLIVAIIIHDWRRPEKTDLPDETIVVTLLPPISDRPADRPVRGMPAEAILPKRVAVEAPSPAVELSRREAVVAADPLPAPADPIDSGKDDRLAQATQAYQRAILARINAERRYPRGALLNGFEGDGTIHFTITRDGYLLDASIVMSTGRKALDRATLALVRRAAPFPAIPAELPDELTVIMPIRFLIVQPELKVASR